MHTHTPTHMYACIYTYLSTHMYTHMHACTHTLSLALSLSLSLYTCIRVVCTGNKNRWLLSTFGPWTVAYIPYSLAKRTYYLRVKKKTVLKSRGSNPHGPVSASRGKGLVEVVGWMRCVLDYGHHFVVWSPSLCGLIAGSEWRQLVSCHCLWF